MSEELFVSQSAPTLAGIKTGNLFTAEFVNHEIAMDEIRQLNVSLTPKGVRVIPLRESKNRMLIYVYRPNCLQVDFTNEDLLEMLRNLKYPVSNPERCIVCLAQRLRECEVFPHEIGLFLGYPPEDVKGFIENKAQNYKIVGTWKVYGDEREAEKRFNRFRKCTADYCMRMEKGSTLDMLAVAL